MAKKIILGTIGGAIAGMVVAGIIFMGLLFVRMQSIRLNDSECYGKGLSCLFRAVLPDFKKSGRTKVTAFSMAS